MKVKSRITSVLNTPSLEKSITGFASFDLSLLRLPEDFDCKLPGNVRLGHLTERVLAEAIRASENFRLLAENIQLVVDKRTIGELDFIVEDLSNGRILHLELAYKFYLCDPRISTEPVMQWIGPNRRDSLSEKLKKLKEKQYPLLYHEALPTQFPEIDFSSVIQASCFLASLYLPYGVEIDPDPAYQKAIKGYYLNVDAFAELNRPSKRYCIPPKTEWGIPPAENEAWFSFEEIKPELIKRLEEKRAPLIWEKNGEEYSEYFVVWWWES